MAKGVIPGKGKVVNFKQSSQSRKDMLAVRELIRSATDGNVAAGTTTILKLALWFAAAAPDGFLKHACVALAEPATATDGN